MFVYYNLKGFAFRLAICSVFLQEGLFTIFLNGCPFDFTAIEGSWKVRSPYRSICVAVVLKPTVSSRSVLVVK